MALVGVKYIGKKGSFTDHLYGSNLIWAPGQTHNVPLQIAQRMMRHTDVYEVYPVSTDQLVTVAEEDVVLVTGEQKDNQPPAVPLPPLDNMTRDELMNFALQHYGEKLHHSMRDDTMRLKIISLINERGR